MSHDKPRDSLLVILNLFMKRPHINIFVFCICSNPNSNKFTDEECRAVCPVINLCGVSKGSGNCLCYYDDGLAPSIIPAGFFDLSDNYSGTGPITKTNLAEDGATCFLYHPAE